MSCQSGSDRGRRKVQVVDNDVAPECGLSSFIARRFTGEIDCPWFVFLFSSWLEVQMQINCVIVPASRACLVREGQTERDM